MSWCGVLGLYVSTGIAWGHIWPSLCSTSGRIKRAVQSHYWWNDPSHRTRPIDVYVWNMYVLRGCSVYLVDVRRCRQSWWNGKRTAGQKTRQKERGSCINTWMGYQMCATLYYLGVNKHTCIVYCVYKYLYMHTRKHFINAKRVFMQCACVHYVV